MDLTGPRLVGRVGDPTTIRRKPRGSRPVIGNKERLSPRLTVHVQQPQVPSRVRVELHEQLSLTVRRRVTRNMVVITRRHTFSVTTAIDSASVQVVQSVASRREQHLATIACPFDVPIRAWAKRQAGHRSAFQVMDPNIPHALGDREPFAVG